jgi:hypothetical protein
VVLLICIVPIQLCSCAFTTSVDWSKNIGTPQTEDSVMMALNHQSGEMCIGGTTTGKIAADTDMQIQGDRNNFVMCTNSSGSVYMLSQFGVSGATDYMSHIAIHNPTGNVYTCTNRGLVVFNRTSSMIQSMTSINCMGLFFDSFDNMWTMGTDRALRKFAPSPSIALTGHQLHAAVVSVQPSYYSWTELQPSHCGIILPSGLACALRTGSHELKDMYRVAMLVFKISPGGSLSRHDGVNNNMEIFGMGGDYPFTTSEELPHIHMDMFQGLVTRGQAPHNILVLTRRGELPFKQGSGDFYFVLRQFNQDLVYLGDEYRLQVPHTANNEFLGMIHESGRGIFIHMRHPDTPARTSVALIQDLTQAPNGAAALQYATSYSLYSAFEQYAPAVAVSMVLIEPLLHVGRAGPGMFVLGTKDSTNAITGADAGGRDAFLAHTVRACVSDPGWRCNAQNLSLAQVQCSAGTFCPHGSTAEQLCSLGSYCPAGSGTEQPCDAGYFCPTPHARQPCSQGYFCPSGATAGQLCSLGSYCPAGSSTEQPCDAGYFCPTPHARQPCSQGYFCPSGASRESMCPKGTSSEFMSDSMDDCVRTGDTTSGSGNYSQRTMIGIVCASGLACVLVVLLCVRCIRRHKVERSWASVKQLYPIASRVRKQLSLSVGTPQESRQYCFIESVDEVMICILDLDKTLRTEYVQADPVGGYGAPYHMRIHAIVSRMTADQLDRYACVIADAIRHHIHFQPRCSCCYIEEQVGPGASVFYHKGACFGCMPHSLSLWTGYEFDVVVFRDSLNSIVAGVKQGLGGATSDIGAQTGEPCVPDVEGVDASSIQLTKYPQTSEPGTHASHGTGIVATQSEPLDPTTTQNSQHVIEVDHKVPNSDHCESDEHYGIDQHHGDLHIPDHIHEYRHGDGHHLHRAHNTSSMPGSIVVSGNVSPAPELAHAAPGPATTTIAVAVASAPAAAVDRPKPGADRDAIDQRRHSSEYVCAQLGCVCALFFPICGFVSYCVNRNAPNGSSRLSLARIGVALGVVSMIMVIAAMAA